MDLILERGSSCHDFRVEIDINLIFVRGIQFDLVLVLVLKVTCFLCGGAKLTVCGPKSTCFEQCTIG